jgi:hypothetical protein
LQKNNEEMQVYTHRCESYIQYEQGEVARYKNHAELLDQQSKRYDQELRQAEHVLAVNRDKVVNTEQAAREAVLRAQKDAAALADVVLSPSSEVASKTQALQNLEHNHQLAMRYHEQGSNQQMNQKDRLFDEMAAAQSNLEHECNILRSQLARNEQTARSLNVGRSDIHAEMLRHENRASSLSGEHASMARRLQQLESSADLHHTRVEIMLDKANEKASHLSEELVQERGANNLLESDIASLQAEMQQKWEESREYEQWSGSRQLSPEKPKEKRLRISDTTPVSGS